MRGYHVGFDCHSRRRTPGGDCGFRSLDDRGSRCDRSVQRSVKVSWIRRSPSKTDHEAVAASATTMIPTSPTAARRHPDCRRTKGEVRRGVRLRQRQRLPHLRGEDRRLRRMLGVTGPWADRTAGELTEIASPDDGPVVCSVMDGSVMIVLKSIQSTAKRLLGLDAPDCPASSPLL